MAFALNIGYCDTGGNWHPGGGQPPGQLCLVMMFCRIYINKIYGHPQKDRTGPIYHSVSFCRVLTPQERLTTFDHDVRIYHFNRILLFHLLGG